MQLSKFSLGMGDRFGHQGLYQLRAISQALEKGVLITPVWNKSNREHTIIGSEPNEVRQEADAAVKALGWKEAYAVDADHISLKTVDRFLEASDFFTLDVAEQVGETASPDEEEAFLTFFENYLGRRKIPGIEREIDLPAEKVRKIAKQYLAAMLEAGRIYRHIRASKESFVTEVSVDETDSPQTPEELFVILGMLAFAKVPAQTIAPKFTGRFNKGVDYVGDLQQFEAEFDADLSVIRYSIETFGFPADLKLSVHSGSDKFSLYPIINRLIRKHGAGLHVKTAGTTWLEELIGLAEAGELSLVKEIYREAYHHFDELAAPYATVIDIHPERLPSPETVGTWSREDFTGALRHIQTNPLYNPDFRQLLHVAFKVAARRKEEYLGVLKKNAEIVGENVSNNLYNRHILPIYFPAQS